MKLPARSFTPVEPPLIVVVYDVENASWEEGVNVAVRPSEVTCPVILAPALFFRINVEVVTVIPSTFSLNVALMTELAATPVAPPAGAGLVTVGGVLSDCAAVVNDQLFKCHRITSQVFHTVGTARR